MNVRTVVQSITLADNSDSLPVSRTRQVPLSVLLFRLFPCSVCFAFSP